MNEVVNVQGNARQPIMVANELYQRGDRIDITITRAEFNSIGWAFFERMLDGLRVHEQGQRPEEAEEKIEEETEEADTPSEESKAEDEVAKDTPAKPKPRRAATPSTAKKGR